VLAERCWAELRATAVDLGHGWDDGATLRRRARDLQPVLVAAPGHAASGHAGAAAPASFGESAGAEDPVEALERLVLLVERSRYSRTGLTHDDADGLVGATRTITGALLDAAAIRRRRRAQWLPRSLWLGRRRLTTRSGAEEDFGRARLERLSV
jgi:hypothetical protein